MNFDDDADLFAAMRSRLSTAVVGDILDTMGLLHQFLPPHIRALRGDMVVVGRAMPVLEADFFSASDPGGRSATSAKPFGLMFEALDNLKPDEIYVATGASPRYALCGELMSTRALHLNYGVAVEIGGIRIRRGDILFGDRDGVLVVPREAEEQAIRLAFEKAETENKVRLAIEAGMSTVKAFERFGVM